MKKCLFPLMLALFFIKTQAQDTTVTYDPDRAVMVTFGAGGSYNDYENLNDRLSGAGILPVGKFALSNMLEADIRMKKLLMGFNGGMNLSVRRDDDYNTWLAGIYGGLQFGYYVANNKNFHFAPQVGIVGYGSFVKISDRNGHDDFDDLLAEGNTITISQFTPALDFALRFDFADFSKSKTGMAGFRLGYRLGLSKRGWGDDVSSSSLDNSPEDRISQFYAMATIGLTALKPNNWKHMH